MIYKPACDQTGSAQGDYRFTLVQPGEKVLLTIGLNPSTANETRPDPTVRKVKGFAERGGYDGFVMLNLSAERATDKWKMSPELDEELHLRNVAAIGELARRYPAADVLVAFGDDIAIRPYLKRCLRDICAAMEGCCGRWLKIGDLTRKGNPRHPLYARYDWGLTTFDIGAYLSRMK